MAQHSSSVGCLPNFAQNPINVRIGGHAQQIIGHERQSVFRKIIRAAMLE
jgi:hypothetical protein